MKFLIKAKTLTGIAGLTGLLAFTIGLNLPASANSDLIKTSTSETLINSQTHSNLAQLSIPREVIQTVGGDLSTIILADERFGTLAKVLQITGLLDELKKGNFTIFAPTDEAFANLGEEVLTNLLKAENLDQLTQLLKYHVIQGTVTSSQLKSGQVATVEGDAVTVNVSPNQVMIGDAKVIEPDISASNGTIHVIDKVLVLPE